ncbi:MAG: TolA protein, partial [Myxococcaceae bacterium]|nr:TolA protein [Myxococcaceae bacterium]
EGGAEAAELLEKLGPAAADRLAARWPELPARGRRRGLKVLAHALPLETVRQRVLETAQSDDAELRERAIAVLARGGEPGRVGLRQLALVSGAAGDQAALALANHVEELPALLSALMTEGAADRASLRKALVIVERRDPGAARAAATAWLDRAPSVSARAALALSFASAGDRDFTATLADAHAPSAQSFEDRYRFALALASATPSEPGNAWLTAQSEQADEWMQRSVALSALVQRKASSVTAVAEKAALDAYPRVRANALEPLLSAGQAERIEAALSKDAWPLVRVEAARVLAARAESRPALELAVADRSRLVRRAAIDALAGGRRAEAWPRVRERLLVADESLEVREAAIAFARQLCLGEARETLRSVANKVLSPEASDEDSQAAVEALRALHDLGGEAAKDGAGVVSKEGGPELKKLWDGLPTARCGGPPQA